MTTIKNIFIGLIASAVLITSCKNEQDKQSDQTSVLSPDSLLTQIFTINADKDTSLVGKSGTIIRIYKNTFVDKSDNFAKGIINIELKEAIKMSDIALANLTTLSNGKLIQTAGMVFINASQNGDNLNIAKNGAIGLIIPTDSVRNDMQIFNGVRNESGIDWQEPKALLNQMPAVPVAQSDTLPLKVVNGKVVVDSARIVPSDASESGFGIDPKNQDQEMLFIQDVQQSKGTNYFVQDFNTSYVFTIKKLGWANIDRLFSDPRTKDVELITKIENNSEFKTIYITMVTESMFLPGYQMKNETFSFTHSDDEKPKLPVGASAILFATAYKDKVPYFVIKKITITDKQTVSLKLIPTTLDKLKLDLATQL